MRVTLKTERLILRPFEVTDANSMFDTWASDPEVTKYVTWDAHKDVNVSKQIVNLWVSQYVKEERINFAITLKENNQLIGGIDVVGYLEGIPVIGYVIGRSYWNKGYVTEACKEVIKFLKSLGHNKIIIDALVENIASNKVILKCGGVFQETYEDYWKTKNINVKINRYII